MSGVPQTLQINKSSKSFNLFVVFKLEVPLKQPHILEVFRSTIEALKKDYLRFLLPSKMDIDKCNTLINTNQSSRGSETANEENKSMKRDASNPLFVNHAELAWHEMRRAWVGDRSQTSHTKFRQPILSWTTSFEDLLSSGEPFPDLIPLADVVDLLVDIWVEEGFYN